MPNTSTSPFGRKPRDLGHPDPYVRRIESKLITTPADTVNRLARSRPDDHVVQRLLLQHPHTDIDIVADYFERLLETNDLSAAGKIMGSDVFFRLREIIAHDRARKALVSLVARLGDRNMHIQLLGLLTDPSEAALLILSLVQIDPKRARYEVERRWPDAIPTDACATLLGSTSGEFRLWLIAHVARAQQAPSQADIGCRTPRTRP